MKTLCAFGITDQQSNHSNENIKYKDSRGNIQSEALWNMILQ